jgi:hypothetical protein
MDKTPCVHCRRTGLVRVEVVVKGRETSLNYSCGYCEHSWQSAQTPTPGLGAVRPNRQQAPPGEIPDT